jgi:hypothetical protein
MEIRLEPVVFLAAKRASVQLGIPVFAVFRQVTNLHFVLFSKAGKMAFAAS